MCLDICRFATIIVALTSLGGGGLRAAGLQAGAAKATITPDVKAAKVYMAGFDNNRVATGVHDDLYVRCLALAAGRQTLALCEADVIGLFYDDVLKIRARVKAQAPEVTEVVVGSTHDHEGPDTLGLWGATPFESALDEKYMEWLDERIATTALEALHSMQEARLTLGRDDHPLLALLQGDSRPPYVKDPYLFVMQLEAQSDGHPLATLVNWSDHPETLGGRNTLITADFPRWLCQYVESHAGGIAVFFQGSIGGLISSLGEEVALQDPETGLVAKDGTWRKAELFGNTLGELATRALKQGRNAPVDSLLLRKAVVYVPLHNDRFRAAGALNLFKGRKPLYTDGKIDSSTVEKTIPGIGKLRCAAGREFKTEVEYIQLLSQGQPLAEISTIPGEIYPELVNGGIARYPGADFPDAPFEPTLRAHMHTRFQFVFGLANDELGYMIPKAEWDDQPPWLLNKKDRWYGEINSVGEDVAGVVTRALVRLMEGRQ